MLEVLAASRLVTVGEGTAEVAHEALLREWPRLRGWLEEDTEGRRLHRHITLAAADWDGAGATPGELYRGVRLSSALDWAAEHGDELNALEREFLEASRMASEHEAERGRRANRRLRMLLAAACVALAVAVVAGVVALDQRGDARGAAEVGRRPAARRRRRSPTIASITRCCSRAPGSNSMSRSPPAAACSRSCFGIRLLWVSCTAPTVGRCGHSGVSPDGRLVALGGERGVVTILDTATRQQVGEPYALAGEGVIQQLRFSPDSRTLAVVGEQRGTRRHESEPRPDRRAHRGAAGSRRPSSLPSRMQADVI